MDLGNCEVSLEAFVLQHAYEALISAQLHKKTRRGYLLNRKDARTLLANKIKVNRRLFVIIISEMERKGLVEQRNQGIYLKGMN